jgi:hypothetical protein
MNTQICKAIKDKAIIQFDYHSETRIVEPHCHGVTSKGNEVLRGYQVGGGSVSGNPSPWRLFIVEDIINFKITDKTFDEPRPGYNPDDKGMARICCCL